MFESKEYDGIAFLHSDDFLKKYPLDKRLSGGASGDVYLSSDIYVVKKFTEDDPILGLAKELNVYASYTHPCILKSLHWTVDEKEVYLAMDRGEDIRYAFNKGKISIEEIISDSLSAISFLNSQGIIHGDIKPDNMIYHKGKCKIIDMGLARKSRLSNNGEYYITGGLYSSPYIDIEYRNNQENNIKCEIYALAMSYLAIMNSKNPLFGDVSIYAGTSNTGVDWFFNQAAKLQEDRPSIQKLLGTAPSDLIVRHHTGTLFSESLIQQGPECDKKLGIVMYTAVTLMHKFNYSAESVFLALHLLHRTYYPLLERYEGDDLGHYTYNIARATTILVGCITDDPNKQEMKEITRYDKELEKELYDIITDILILSEGIISSLTYWDYASSKEDLFPLIEDIISCKYNPTLMRRSTTKSNKCVTIQEIISPGQIELFGKAKTTEQMWEPISAATFPVKVKPCLLQIGGDLKKLESYWKEAVDLRGEDFEGTERYYSITLHNRDQLSNLRLDTALKIYKSFYRGNKLLDHFVLDAICKINWRVQKDSVIIERIFPF